MNRGWSKEEGLTAKLIYAHTEGMMRCDGASKVKQAHSLNRWWREHGEGPRGIATVVDQPNKLD